MTSYPYCTKNNIPFVSLSRKRQRRHYIELKNQIRRTSGVLRCVSCICDRMNKEKSWMDGYFLSKAPPLFYILTLKTTRHAYREEIWGAAIDRSIALVSWEREKGIQQQTSLNHRCSGRNREKTWTIHPKCPTFPEFGGLSRIDWATQQEPGLANSGDYHVVENWSVQRDYPFGIGLIASIDVPFLTIEAVIDFIQRFLDGGELDFTSDNNLYYTYAEIADISF
ncbi:MAG: hypothetical protein HQL97_05160 [Magnetococcales bacterium]|nr:hypothetical protein [Magnetococcales bacterium]